MGNANKKSIVTAENAKKKCPKQDWERWGYGYDKLCGNKDMNEKLFTHAVFPNMHNRNLVLRIFKCFDSAKSGKLSRNEFLCIMYLLVHGTFKERTAFLFNLYDTKKKGYLSFRDFQDISRVMDCDVENVVDDLFDGQTSWRANRIHIHLEEFEAWAYENPKNKLINWLDNLSPTKTSPKKKKLMAPNNGSDFWKKPRVSVARTLNLSEKEVTDLERYFHGMDKSSDHVDFETFKSIMENKIPPSMVGTLFNVFDANEDGKIDVREFLVGFSTACRGSPQDQLEFCFRSFDIDKDGKLSREEVEQMVKSLWRISNFAQSLKESFHVESPDWWNSLDKDSQDQIIGTIGDEKSITQKLVTTLMEEYGIEEADIESFLRWWFFKETGTSDVSNNVTKQPKEGFERLVDSIFDEHDIENDGFVSLEGFSAWAMTNSAAQQYIKTVTGFAWSELGIRPQETSQQMVIIKSDLAADAAQEVKAGDKFFMIDLKWWGRFCAFTEIDWIPEITRSIPSYTSLSSDFKSSDVDLETLMKPPAMKKELSISHPGPINNITLLKDNIGGTEILVPNLKENRDFILVGEPIWNKLHNWYGGGPLITRQVIPLGNNLRVELYPVVLKAQSKRTQNDGRHLEASFSRLDKISAVRLKFCVMLKLSPDHARLWLTDPAHKKKERLHFKESTTVADAELADGDMLYIELQNKKTLEWEEDDNHTDDGDTENNYPKGHGLTGLMNLGNTCYFNAAIQCLTHIEPLSAYFMKDLFLHEINKENILGHQGRMAIAFYHLSRELYEEKPMVGRVYPRHMKAVVESRNPMFVGNQQHDAQELLAWVLDALHEDLCRIKVRQYVENRDSKGRPDWIVAAEFWRGYLTRNQSVIVDIFTGQMKSSVAWECGRINNTFDVFNVIELPLPKQKSRWVRVCVMFVEASKPPIRYSVEVGFNHRILDVRNSVSKLCQIPPRRLLITEVYNHCIMGNYFPMASARRLRNDDDYFAYEIFDFGDIKDSLKPPFVIGQKFDVLNKKNKWQTAELIEFKWGAADRVRTWRKNNNMGGRRAAGGAYRPRYGGQNKFKDNKGPPKYDDVVKAKATEVEEKKQKQNSSDKKNREKTNMKKNEEEEEKVPSSKQSPIPEKEEVAKVEKVVQPEREKENKDKEKSEKNEETNEKKGGDNNNIEEPEKTEEETNTKKEESESETRPIKKEQTNDEKREENIEIKEFDEPKKKKNVEVSEDEPKNTNKKPVAQVKKSASNNIVENVAPQVNSRTPPAKEERVRWCVMSFHGNGLRPWTETIRDNSNKIQPPNTKNLFGMERSRLAINMPIETMIVRFVHRKLVKLEEWFIFSHKPKLYGYPMLLCIENGEISSAELYEDIWNNVRRYTSLPLDDNCDVFQGDDEELFPPFELKRVDQNGLSCSNCSWDQACSGCAINYSDETIEFYNEEQIAIDWNSNFFDRYLDQTALMEIMDHPSVQKATEIMKKPITIYKCLENWGETEELSGDCAVYCSKCKKLEDATKTLNLWTLPPVLTFHLNRLQADGKIYNLVEFPFVDFDPWPYLEQGAKRRLPTAYEVPPKTPAPELESEPEEEEEIISTGENEEEEVETEIEKKKEIASEKDETKNEKESGNEEIKKEKEDHNKDIKNSTREDPAEIKNNVKENIKQEKKEEEAQIEKENKNEDENEILNIEKPQAEEEVEVFEEIPKLQAQKSINYPVSEEELKEITDHQLFTNEDPPLYDLVAVINHLGSGRGGHYIAYCKCKDLETNEFRWFEFDDEQVESIEESKVVSDNAYMLFYAQQGFEGLEYKELLGKKPQEEMRTYLEKEIQSSSSQRCGNNSCVML